MHLARELTYTPLSSLSNLHLPYLSQSDTTMLTLLACVIHVLSLAGKSDALNKTCFGGVDGSIQFDIYQTTCPQAEDIIFAGVEQAVLNDPRMAASLLRLHFHDCFVNGCDASVLLDDAPNFVGEKTAGPNLNSLRGFEVIDSIKAELELACPETVSCADILAIVARDSVVLSGGPTWQVEVGRKDGRSASRQAANSNIPTPTSDVATLIRRFQNLGLSSQDMVALSGAHTIGKARCSSFISRLRGGSDTSVGSSNTSVGDRAFLQSLQQLCAESNNTLADLDLSTPATFDNQYYVNLISSDGLLQSDQALSSADSEGVAALVEAYAMDPELFFGDFKASMVRMGRLAASGGSGGGSGGGEVRRSCRVVN